jgi:hypothetical protein
MNTRQGIPLRPDYSGYERSLRDTDRRLVMRGFAAIAVATARGEHAEEVVRNLFPATKRSPASFETPLARRQALQLLRPT